MKILIVEDNRFDADLTKRNIEDKIQDAEVKIARTLAEAQDNINSQTDLDLLLLDLNLPDGNGLELLPFIRSKQNPIAVIVHTGSGDEEVAVSALKSGADDYMVKEHDYVSKLTKLIQYQKNELNKKNSNSTQIIRILYIEHHKADVDLTKRHFKKYAPDYILEFVNTADEAIQKIKSGQEKNRPYHVLLTDYNLPGMNALDLIKIMRQDILADIPIILITGQGNEEIAIQSLKLGADEYLVKRENYLFRLPSLILSAHQRYLLKNQKKALEESEERYKMIANNTADVIFTLDLNLKYTYVSPSVFKLRGYTPEEVMSQDITSSLTKDSYKKTIEVISNYKTSYTETKAESLKPVVIELEMLRKDKTKIWTEVKASLLLDGNKKPVGILGVTREISKRKEYEWELIIAKEKAEESDNLKTAFLQNISHEIRTPMNGIIGFTNLIKGSILSAEKRNKYINLIERSGNRMLNTVRDIIDMAKIQTGEVLLNLDSVNINETMGELYNFFLPKAIEKEINLNLNLNTNEPLIIKTDVSKINAILTNLIENAIKYTKSGSIDLGYKIENSFIQFMVKDTGIGIPPNMRTAIFERFRQVDSTIASGFEGSGLGLSIAKAYIDMLGGKIWVEQNNKKGSTFYFTLPYHPIKVRDKEEIQELYDINLEGFDILIAEDDEINYLYLKEILDSSKAKLFYAKDGQEAIENIETFRNIKLVLMDIKMPRLDGIKATQIIKNKFPNVKVIAQTGYTHQELRNDKNVMLFDEFINKPIDKQELITKIKSCLNT